MKAQTSVSMPQLVRWLPAWAWPVHRTGELEELRKKFFDDWKLQATHVRGLLHEPCMPGFCDGTHSEAGVPASEQAALGRLKGAECIVHGSSEVVAEGVTR